MIWLVLFRLRWALLIILVLATIAVVGYVVLESYGWIDAAYMTVITLGTVGYGETRPLDTTGRVFTMVIIIIGFTTFVYGVSVLTNLFVSGDVLTQMHHRRSKGMRDELENHVIVVGFGRVGQAVVRGLHEMGQQCVVLERNEEMAQLIRSEGGVEMIGDATDPVDLQRAGIGRALALISAADQDSENLVVVLTARSTRKDLRIVARVNHADWSERLEHAGADVVQSPYPTCGVSLAAAAVSETVLDLHELPIVGLATEEIQVAAGSALMGIRVRGWSTVPARVDRRATT